MSNYEKPVVVMAEESTEGVYLASGDHLEQCRFGRTEASAGADACQECSKSGGKRATPFLVWGYMTVVTSLLVWYLLKETGNYYWRINI